MMDPHLAHLSSNDAPFWLIGKREREREKNKDDGARCI